MRFIALLISFALERFVGIGAKIRCYQWFDQYVNLLKKALDKTPLWRSWMGVFFILAPVFIATALIQYLLQDHLYGLLSLMFAVFSLIYCLGESNFSQLYTHYQEAIVRNDQVASDRYLSQLIGSNAEKSEEKIHRHLTQALIVQANQRVFAIIFWFMVLGAAGAVFYRFVTVLKNLARNAEYHEFLVVCDRLQNSIDWIPARLLALTYALVGDFTAGFSYWIDHFITGASNNEELLVHCGLAAITAEEQVSEENAAAENKGAVALIERALIFWGLIIGIGTIAVWLL